MTTRRKYWLHISSTNQATSQVNTASSPQTARNFGLGSGTWPVAKVLASGTWSRSWVGFSQSGGPERVSWLHSITTPDADRAGSPHLRKDAGPQSQGTHRA